MNPIAATVIIVVIKESFSPPPPNKIPPESKGLGYSGRTLEGGFLQKIIDFQNVLT